MFTPVRAAQQTTLRKNCPYSELFWSAFSSHFPILLRISSYSVRMRENAGKMRTRITPNTAVPFTPTNPYLIVRHSWNALQKTMRNILQLTKSKLSKEVPMRL